MDLAQLAVHEGVRGLILVDIGEMHVPTFRLVVDAPFLELGKQRALSHAGRTDQERCAAGGFRDFFPGNPVAKFLKLSRSPAGWTGEIWAAEGRPRLPWPAFVNDLGPLPVEVLSVGPGEDGGVRAQYRVTPSADDPLVLEVVEEYRLDERGDLVGTMTVVFTIPEGERGGFVLNRRFERVR